MNSVTHSKVEAGWSNKLDDLASYLIILFMTCTKSVKRSTFVFVVSIMSSVYTGSRDDNRTD